MTYRGKSYDLLDIPSESDSLVKEEIKEIEKQLRLNHLSKDLSKLGIFVSIAYLGVKWDHPDLETFVWKGLKNVFCLCHDTEDTLNSFEHNSRDAVNNLNGAYLFLKDNQEAAALEKLGTLLEISNEMKDKAHTLLQQCKEQSQIMQQVRDDVISAIMHGNENTMKELQKEKQQMNEEISSGEKEIEDNEQIETKNRNLQYKMNEIIDKLYKKKKTKRQEAIAQSLHVAIYPLNNIELIMKNIEGFWEKVEKLCKSMVSSSRCQVKIVSNREPQCKRIWQTDAFKIDTLMCYVKWIALKVVYAAAHEDVCSTLDEIQDSIVKDDDKNKTFEIIISRAENLHY